MSITIPDLDAGDEETQVATVIDSLPSEFSDRNRSAVAVKLIEAVGAFYGLTLAALNQLPNRLYLTLLGLLGLEQTPAAAATVTLTFTAGAGGSLTVPAGTEVRTGSGIDAVKFTTDAELIVTAGNSDTVAATATATGEDGNVGADTLTTTDPLTNLASVTNAAAATGGADEETIASLIERAPLSSRVGNYAVASEDFEILTEQQSGVRRAIPQFADSTATVAIVGDDLNEAYAGDSTDVDEATLRETIRAAVQAATFPGVTVTIVQGVPRLVVVDEVEVELEAGATAGATAARITTSLSRYISATNITEGNKQLANEWELAQPLYYTELVSLIDQVEGVKRVGRIFTQQSDDFGSTWTAAAELTTSIAAGWDGDGSSPYGLLQWGGPNDLDATGWFTGYALTLTEL